MKWVDREHSSSVTIGRVRIYIGFQEMADNSRKWWSWEIIGFSEGEENTRQKAKSRAIRELRECLKQTTEALKELED